jgi:hypothetical protein
LFAHSRLELTHLHVKLGPVVPGSQAISEAVQSALLQHYNSGGVQRVHHFLARNPSAGSRLLKANATRFYEYALLDGRRITPTTRTRRKTAGSCLVKVMWEGKMFAGVVESIFHHDQPSVANATVWAEMRWMKYLDLSPVEGDPWSIVSVSITYCGPLKTNTFVQTGVGG